MSEEGEKYRLTGHWAELRCQKVQHRKIMLNLMSVLIPIHIWVS